MADTGIIWEEALDGQTRELVYRFRHEHYFSGKEYLPGTDAASLRVHLPHDDHSRHFLARAETGEMVAVGTVTPGTEPSIGGQWRSLLNLDLLAPILPKLVIFSRVIIAREARGSLLFGQLFLRLGSLFHEQGYRYAAHYCAPDMVGLYERMGYRQYSPGMTLHGRVFRVPLLLVTDDRPHLQRLRSPLRALSNASGGDAGWLEQARTICPDLDMAQLCLMDEQAVIARLTGLCPMLAPSPALAHAARRGSILPLRRGDILAGEGIDAGAYVVLQGSMGMGGSQIGPGGHFQTGQAAVTALADSLLLALRPEQLEEACGKH